MAEKWDLWPPPSARLALLLREMAAVRVEQMDSGLEQRLLVKVRAD